MLLRFAWQTGEVPLLLRRPQEDMSEASDVRHQTSDPFIKPTIISILATFPYTLIGTP